MAKDSHQSARTLDADDTGGLLSGLLAEENEFDRRTLWRIGSWGIAAVAAVVIAVMANQSSLGWRREQVAAADLALQAQQIRSLARESQNETRRLGTAIDTLNNDRDRLYSRVTVLEQGLDSVTGAIAKQSATVRQPAVAATNVVAGNSPVLDAQPAPQSQTPLAPAVAAVTTTPPPPTTEKQRAEAALPVVNAASASTKAVEKARETTKPPPNVAMAAQVSAPPTAPTPVPPLGPAKSIMGPPDPAAPKLVEAPKPSEAAMAAVPPEAALPRPATEPAAAETDTPKAAIQRTEFAVDLGGANSIGGLRALWRGILKSNAELAALHPIIVVKESTTGPGMQLRLAAGPLQDAAAAAKICAALLESERGCETTVFDGQRLAMAADEAQPPPAGAKAAPAIKPMPVKRGYYTRHAKKDDAPPPPSPPKQDSSVLSSWFGANKH
jgi:hypothetical protein